MQMPFSAPYYPMWCNGLGMAHPSGVPMAGLSPYNACFLAAPPQPPPQYYLVAPPGYPATAMYMPTSMQTAAPVPLASPPPRVPDPPAPTSSPIPPRLSVAGPDIASPRAARPPPPDPTPSPRRAATPVSAPVPSPPPAAVVAQPPVVVVPPSPPRPSTQSPAQTAPLPSTAMPTRRSARVKAEAAAPPAATTPKHVPYVKVLPTKHAKVSVGENGKLPPHVRVSPASYTGPPHYKCHYCEYTADSANILRHERIHSGDKPFKCVFPGCEYASARSDDVVKHFRRHANERRFQCTRCGFSALDVSSLHYHERTHDGEKAQGAVTSAGAASTAATGAGCAEGVTSVPAAIGAVSGSGCGGIPVSPLFVDTTSAGDVRACGSSPKAPGARCLDVPLLCSTAAATTSVLTAPALLPALPRRDAAWLLPEVEQGRGPSARATPPPLALQPLPAGSPVRPNSSEHGVKRQRVCDRVGDEGGEASSGTWPAVAIARDCVVTGIELPARSGMDQLAAVAASAAAVACVQSHRPLGSSSSGSVPGVAAVLSWAAGVTESSTATGSPGLQLGDAVDPCSAAGACCVSPLAPGVGAGSEHVVALKRARDDGCCGSDDRS